MLGSARLMAHRVWSRWFSSPKSVVGQAHSCIDNFEQLYGNRSKDFTIACFYARRALDDVTIVNTAKQQRLLVEAALRSLSVKREKIAPGIVTILSWFLTRTRSSRFSLRKS